MSALSILRESGRGVRLGLSTAPFFWFGVRCYCTRLLRLSHKRHGDDVACVTLLGQIDANGIRHHWHGGETVKLMSDASSRIDVVMLVVFLGLFWILSRKLERVVERS